MEKASSGVKMYSWCSVPKTSAMARAAMMSGELAIPTVNDLMVDMSVSSDISFATMAESSPPERRRPYPTSDMSRFCTAALRMERTRSVPRVPRGGGGASGRERGASHSGSKYRSYPRSRVHTCPGGTSSACSTTPTKHLSSEAKMTRPPSRDQPR